MNDYEKKADQAEDSGLIDNISDEQESPSNN
jgi:hypothetical protein